MARDAVALMRHFGFDAFSVAGHDRGGRVAYRLALDHPARVRQVAALDIIPTGEVFRRTTMASAMGYWHWFFLAQPFDLPERLIGANPDAYYFRDREQARAMFAPEALADYLRCVHDPETIHAMCEDYRAGATFDFELDESERGKRTITSPLLVLWGRKGALERWYDVLAVWRDWAEDVRGRGIDCGHYLAEEAPEATYTELKTFFCS
jgi:haloacetate dehalogenase